MKTKLNFKKDLIVTEELKNQIVEYRNSMDLAIFKALVETSDTMAEVAKQFGVGIDWVRRVNQERNAGRKKGTGSPSHPQARAATNKKQEG